jgi:dihydrodipicolinate reductase
MAHGAPAPEELDVSVIRAGSAPGMHLVGFDAPGESLEMRLTARDRSAYAAGAITAAEWLLAESRSPGFHSFDDVVDSIVANQSIGSGSNGRSSAATRASVAPNR